MKILFVDTETTGLSPKKQDIIQIGAVVMENRTVIDEINIKCQPVQWDNINSYALKVNNSTVEQLKTYELPRDAWDKFHAFVTKHHTDEGYVFGGQNCKFDKTFLSTWWDNHSPAEEPEFDHYLNGKTLELMNITNSMKKYGFLDVKNVKLPTIVEALDIKVDGNLHDAVTDIKATINCTYKLLIRIKKMKAAGQAKKIVEMFDEWLEILG